MTISPVGVKLLLRAFMTVVVVRICLWMIPSPRVLRAVASRICSHAGISSAGKPDVRRVAWAIQVASRRVPRASCLTQALAGRLLLARYGHSSHLRVGVRRDEHGSFLAHAWVETDAGPVIGDVALDRYQSLPDLQKALH